MSSLAIVNALPDPRQQVESLQRELYARNRQLADAEEELRRERAKNGAVEQGAAELQQVLTPLYSALQHVFGVTEGMGVTETGTPIDARKNAAWEQWKQRLGGSTARAIDVLMVHGSLNNTQLRIHLACATGTVTNVITALKKYDLIVKENGKIRLKEL